MGLSFFLIAHTEIAFPARKYNGGEPELADITHLETKSEVNVNFAMP